MTLQTLIEIDLIFQYESEIKDSNFKLDKLIVIIEG